MDNKRLSKVALRLLVFLLMSLSVQEAFSQDVQIGTIERLDQDNGSIVISGRALPYSDQVTEVFLNDHKIGSHKIDVGMVVRYTLNTSGQLLRIELIGPSEMIRELETN